MNVQTCGHCGKNLKVSPQHAGKKLRCPHCKGIVEVQTDDAEAPTMPPRELPPEQVSHSGSRTTDEIPDDAAANGISDVAAAHETLLAQSRYHVAAEIARGGMGAIMRAFDADICREVAVKFLLNNADERQKARFVEEAQITGQLEHPNIVPIHQLGVQADGQAFFAMKMVKGRSLAELLKSPGGDFTVSRCVNILISVCNALSYAHARRVIHRDLKPANIMIGDFGEVYVMDWGLAKVLERPEDVAPTMTAPASQDNPADSKNRDKVTSRSRAGGDLTQSGAILGTPAYMPPEQAQGNPVDERGDVYAIGAILYEMMTLTPPVRRGNDMMATLMNVIEGRIDPPRQRAPERVRAGWVTPELSAIALKALAFRPEDRYATVADMRRDLELYLEDRSVSAKHDSTFEVVRKFVRRHKGLTVGLFLAFLVVLGSLAIILSAWRETDAAWHETNAAYAKYEKEQTDKAERTRQAVPALIEAARQAISQHQFDNAMAQVSVALDYDPDNASALLLKGMLLVERKQFTDAAKFLQRHVQVKPDSTEAAALAKLCLAPDPNAIGTQNSMAQALIQLKQPTLAVNFLTTAEQKLAHYRKQLGDAGMLASNLVFDKDRALSFGFNGLNAADKFLDLNALRGIPLSSLRLLAMRVQNLEPLRGMPLEFAEFLDFHYLTDLSALGATPLKTLHLKDCGVKSLESLKGTRLRELRIHQCMAIQDLGGLRGMPLKKLTLADHPETFIMKITDLEPLRGMLLEELNCSRTQIADLSPLRGMPLRILDISSNPVKDLEPLRGMQLESLVLHGTVITDLKPLQGMPLTNLNCNYNPLLVDLSPIRQLPLKSLFLPIPVRDLSVLDGLKLEIISLIEPCSTYKGLDTLRNMKTLKTIYVIDNRRWDSYVPDQFFTAFAAGKIK